MDTKTLVTVLVVLALILGGFVVFQWITSDEESPEAQNTEEQTERTQPSSRNPISNPTEALEDVNPAAQANPFSGSYRNPFE